MRRPVKFGKYLLLDRISIGGMAEVFKAKTFGLEGFEKIVAIKRILPALGKDPDFVDMFIDEAKISGQLAHANVGQIHELGKVDDAHFIAMEFIWGRDLLQLQNRYRKNKKRLSTRTACYIVMKVCEGLQYAHKKRDVMGQEMKIVHRDCSPQNIVVSFEGEVKLIDFGIAKAEQRNAHTTAGVLKGKFAYMSPEQVRGLPLDRRTDIFSMGIILYESLTGKRLFNGENDFTTLEKVRNAIVESKELLAAKVPPEVERIVRKALAKNAESRYQWCSEMRDDLNAYLKGSEDVFSNRVLGQEMSQAFSVELARERELMDVYARLDKDGVLADGHGSSPAGSVSPEQDDDYSEVLVEKFEPVEQPELLDLSIELAPNEFVDTPTEIFGELGLMDMIGDVEDFGSAQPLTSDGESIKIEVADPELVMIEVDTPAPTPAPSRPSAPVLSESRMDSGVQPFGSFSPAVATAVTMAPGASPKITMSFPEVSTTESVPNPGIRLTTNSGALANRNTLLGVGLAVAVILVALGVKVMFFGAAQQATASRAHATLVLVVDDSESAVAFVDGKEMGLVPSGDSLTLNDLPAGSHSVHIRRNGVGLCDAKLKLKENKIKVFNCDPTSLAVGMLNIEGLEDGDTLVVDGTPVTGEELARPLTLKANKQHRVALSRPGRGFMEFRVTLTPGEKRVHTLVWPEETPDSDAGVEEFMDMKPDRVAPGGERNKYQDRKKAAEERDRKNGAAGKFSLGKIPTIATKTGGSDPQAKQAKDDSNEESGVGFLTVWSEPWARIYIDGKDTGKQTPVVRSTKFTLSVGKHRVTLKVGAVEHNFSVTIVPGKFVRLSKFLTED